MPPVYTQNFITYFIENRKDKIVLIGSSMSYSAADAHRETVRTLLAATELVKLPAKDLVFRNLVIVAFPTGDNSLFICRGVITDIQLWKESVRVQVLLVDECQKDVVVSPDWIFSCPRSLSVYPTVIQQYILADILPANKEWPVNVISYLHWRLVEKSVPVIRDIDDDKFGYISPLEPDRFGLPLVCQLIIENLALPAVSFPGLITGVLKDLQKEYPKLTAFYMPLRKESTPSERSTRNLTYQAMPPPSNSYEDCQISHCMAGPWKFYLQFKQQIESYRKLQGRLKLYFETGKLDRSSLKIGSSVLCYISNMVEEEYQRGLVTGEIYNNEVPVYLVDKGATLKLRKDTLWELPVELLDTPICMFKCCLDGLPVVVDSEVTNAFGEVVLIHPLKGKVVRMDALKLIKVSLLASGCDVLQMIIPGFKRSKLVTNCKATISYVCKSNDIIYLHLSSDSHKLEELQKKLQERSHSAVPVENTKVDMVCMAYYEDGCWYRGIVLEAGDYIKVKYVDYGNIEVVSPGSVRELSLDLVRELPSQAIPCILNDVPMKAVTSELVEEIFGPIGEKEFHVKIICNTERNLDGLYQEVSVVEMISEVGLSFNFSLQEKLKDCLGAASSIPSGAKRFIGKDGIKKENPKMFRDQERSLIVNKFGLSKLPGVEVKPGTYSQVRLSCVGRACFFVTLLEKENLIQDIREIMKKCQDVKKCVEGLSTGWLVASFDDCDRMWHRGLVTGCVGQLVELTLIDSGKDLVVERPLLQKLPDTPLVLSTPAQAIKCTLSDGSLNPIRLEHMKKDIGSCFLALFHKEESGLWEVRLYDEKIVGSCDELGPENSTLPYKSESVFSREEPSKHYKEESKPVPAFLRERSNSFEKNSTNNNVDSQIEKLVEETHWEKSNTQHLSTPGPIRNKSRRYHGASAGDKWRDGSNGSGKAFNSQWRGKSISSISSTQSEETIFEKPVKRTKEFGLFRNRLQSEVPDIQMKTNGSQILPNLNRNTFDKDSRSFSEVKNQGRKGFSRRPAGEELWGKSNVTEDGSFMKSSHIDDSWSENQNKQSGCVKEMPSIPQNKIMCDSEFDAIITYVEDDGSFWIQACSQIPVLDKLMDDINVSSLYSLQVLTATPEIGKPYLCLYVEDGRYYRSVVKEVCDNDHALVHYVDYGNSIEVKASEMRSIPSKFCDLPCQAAHCYFSKILREQSIDVLHQNITEIFPEELKVSLSLELQDEHCLIMKSCRVRDIDILSKIHEEQANRENVSSRSGVQVNQIKVENSGYTQIPHLTIDYEAEMTAHLCHIDTNGMFWTQLADNIVALEEVMERLNEVVNPSNITLLTSPVPGMPCLCQYSEDQRFYRAEVIEVLAMEGTTSVLYVDYGNVDNIRKENLAVLPEEFMALPRQAICCSFSKEIRSKWSHFSQSYLEAFIEHECVLALVEESEDSGPKNVIVKFTIDGLDILSSITPEAEIDVGVKSEVVGDNVNIPEASIPILSLSYNSEIAAYVSHVENGLLWIQLVDQLPALEEMEEKLNEYTLLSLAGAPEIGCVYACRFADDGRLYRAVVKDVSADGLGVTVHYIDHGNNSHAEVDNLFAIPSALVALPRQAILCHFRMEEQNGSLMTIKCMDELLNQEVALSLTGNTEENRNILSSCKLDGKDVFSVPQCVSIDGHEKVENLNKLEGFENGLGSIKATVSPVISEASLAFPSCLPLKFNEIFKAYVCHVENDSIWVQRADQIAELEESMQKLNEKPPTVLQTIPSRNCLCVAQYSIDGRYYRCMIQEISDKSSAVVHFVDYGNSEKVAIGDLYEIPDYFQSLPRQAVRCYFKENVSKVDLHSLLEQVLDISVHMEEEVETIIILDVCRFNGVNVLPDFPEVIPEVYFENDIEKPNMIKDIPDVGEMSDFPEVIPEVSLEKDIEEPNMIKDIIDTEDKTDFPEVVPEVSIEKDIEEPNMIKDIPVTEEKTDFPEVVPGVSLEKDIEEPNRIKDIPDVGEKSDFPEVVPEVSLEKNIEEPNMIKDIPVTEEKTDFPEVVPGVSLEKDIEEPNIIKDIPDVGEKSDFPAVVPGVSLEKDIEEPNIIKDIPFTEEKTDFPEGVPGVSLEKDIEEPNMIKDIPDVGEKSDFPAVVPGVSLEKDIEEPNMIKDIPDTGEMSDFPEEIPEVYFEMNIEEPNMIKDIPDTGEMSAIPEVIPGVYLEKDINEPDMVIDEQETGEMSDFPEMIPGVSLEKKREELGVIVDVPDTGRKQEEEEYDEVTDEIIEDNFMVTSKNLSVSQNHDNRLFNATYNIRRSSAGDISNATKGKLEHTLLKYNSLEQLPVQENEKSNLCFEIGLETFMLKEKPISTISLELDKGFLAVISHFAKEGSLWIQVCDNLPALSDMMEKLNEINFDSLEHLKEQPVVDSLYACLCSEDGRLYRASVKSVCQDSRCVVVHYVDYGSEEKVRFDDLHRIPVCFLSVPIQAVQCYFSKTIREGWSESHQRQIEVIKGEGEVNVQVSIDDSDCERLVFKEFHYETRDVLAILQEARDVENNTLDNRSTVSLEDIDIDDFGEKDSEKGLVLESLYESPITQLKRTVTLQDLQVDDCEIKKELPDAFDQDSDQQFASHYTENVVTKDKFYVQSTFDKLVDTPKDSERYWKRFSAVICHIENDGSLWLQSCDQLSTLRDMRTKLNDLTKSSLEPFAKDTDKIGSLCLCTYTADELLYRVSVKKLLHDQNLAVVCYIDYGYEECVKVEELRKAPENFVTLPMQAVHCYFSNHIRENWSDYCQQLIIGIKSKVSVCVVSDPEGESNLVLEELYAEDLDIVRMLNADIERTTDHEVLYLDSQIVDMKNGTMRETHPDMKIDSEQSLGLSMESKSVLSVYSKEGFDPNKKTLEDTSADYILDNFKGRNEENNAVAESCLSEDTESKLIFLSQNSIDYDVTFDAVISHIESNGSLWLQATTHLLSLNNMMEKLNKFSIDSLEPLEDAFTGCPCVCQYTEDGRIYRAVVKEVNNDDCLALVCYVDYGYEDWMRLEDLRRIPEDIGRSFFHLPMQAVHCYFGRNVKDSWWEYCRNKHLVIEDEVKVSVSLSEDGVNVLNRLVVQELDVLSDLVEAIEKQSEKDSDEILGIKGNESNLLISFDSEEDDVPERLDKISLCQQQQDVIDDWDYDGTIRDSINVEENRKYLKENEVKEKLGDLSRSDYTENKGDLGIEVCPGISEASPIMKEADGVRCINKTICIDSKNVDKDMKEDISEQCFLTPSSGDGPEKVIEVKNIESLVDFIQIQAEQSSNAWPSNEGKIYLEEASRGKEVFDNEEYEAVDGRSIRSEQDIFVSTLTDEEPLLHKSNELFDLDEHSFTEKCCCFNVLEKELQSLTINQGKELQSPLDIEERPNDVYNKQMVSSSIEHRGTDKFSGEKILTDLCLDEQSFFRAASECMDEPDSVDTGKVITQFKKLELLKDNVTLETESEDFFFDREEISDIFCSESLKFCKEFEADKSETDKYLERKEELIHVGMGANERVLREQQIDWKTDYDEFTKESQYEQQASDYSFEKHELEIQQLECESVKYQKEEDTKLIEGGELSCEADELPKVFCSSDEQFCMEDSGYLHENTKISHGLKDFQAVCLPKQFPSLEVCTLEEEDFSGRNIALDTGEETGKDEVCKILGDIPMTMELHSAPDIQASEDSFHGEGAQNPADKGSHKQYFTQFASSVENVTFLQKSLPQVESAFSEVQSPAVSKCLEHDSEVVEPEENDRLHEGCRIGSRELDTTCRSCSCVKMKKCDLHEKDSKEGAQSLPDKKKAFAPQPNLVSGSKVFIKDVHTSGCVCMYLEKNLGRLCDIQQSLQDSAEQLQEPENILPGMACVAESEDGKTWYRATILQVEEGKANIYFVDYGTKELVPQEKLKEIPTNLLDPAFIYTCKLEPKDKQVDSSFDQTHSSAIPYVEKPLVLTAEDGEGEQKLTFQYCGEEVLGDCLCSFPMPVSEELACTDLPTCCGITGSEAISLVDVDLTPGDDWSVDKSKSFLHSIDEEDEDSDESCVIQHYKALVVNVEENPFSLWVQKEEDFNLVTFIAKTLENEGSGLEVLQHPEKGQLCLCVLKGVKQRAKLISYDDNTALVHYIDLGKYDIVSRQELYRLVVDLIDIHPLASQVFLPVAIKKGMEIVSGTAIAEVALAKLCFCIDVRTLADRKIKTVVVSDGIGDLGEYLVAKDLATSFSFDTHVKEEVTPLVNNFFQALANIP